MTELTPDEKALAELARLLGQDLTDEAIMADGWQPYPWHHGYWRDRPQQKPRPKLKAPHKDLYDHLVDDE